MSPIQRSIWSTVWFTVIKWTRAARTLTAAALAGLSGIAVFLVTFFASWRLALSEAQPKAASTQQASYEGMKLNFSSLSVPCWRQGGTRPQRNRHWRSALTWGLLTTGRPPVSHNNRFSVDFLQARKVSMGLMDGFVMTTRSQRHCC